MALNVDISAIYLGNYADTDTWEGNYAVENAADLLGTYGSETDPLWTHRVTLDSDSPTPYIDTDHDTGNGTLSYDAGAGPVTVGLDSFVEYNATITYEDGTTEVMVIDIIQTLNGDVFFIPYDNYTQLDDKPIESLELQGVADDGWAGFQQTSYDAISFICFTPGTRIATPDGPRAVERLAVGELVVTLDHGAEPLVWIGRRRLQFPGAAETQKPVVFRPGSLGHDVPRRQLVVSPQHRLLVSAPELAAATGEAEALAPAIGFTGLSGVRRMKGKRRVDYVALMLARHEVIRAEGAWVESFYPGPTGLATLSPFEVLSLKAALPGHGRARMRPARRLLDAARARQLSGGGAAAVTTGRFGAVHFAGPGDSPVDLAQKDA